MFSFPITPAECEPVSLASGKNEGVSAGYEEETAKTQKYSEDERDLLQLCGKSALPARTQVSTQGRKATPRGQPDHATAPARSPTSSETEAPGALFTMRSPGERGGPLATERLSQRSS